MTVQNMQTPMISGSTPASPLNTALEDERKTLGNDEYYFENLKYLLRDHHMSKLAKPIWYTKNFELKSKPPTSYKPDVILIMHAKIII